MKKYIRLTFLLFAVSILTLGSTYAQKEIFIKQIEFELEIVSDIDYENEYFTIGAIKLVSDGSIQGYTGFLSLPYHHGHKGDMDYRGYPTMEAAALNDLVKEVHAAGLQLAIHANGDAAIDRFIHAVRAARFGAGRP